MAEALDAEAEIADLHRIAADAAHGEFDCLELPEKLTAAAFLAERLLAERRALASALNETLAMAELYVPVPLQAPGFKRARAALNL